MSGRDKRENAGRAICPFPGCGKVYTPVDGAAGCCSYHQQLILDINFIQHNVMERPVALIPKSPASGLVVPRPGEILLRR